MMVGVSEQDESTDGRRARRDVQRNLVSLLAAAKEVFAASGVDAPAKEITDRAGVGVGTLYRHFPKRSDLIIAVLQQEIDSCVAAATATLTRPTEPFEALTEWIELFMDLVATKQGLAKSLHSADPAYDGLLESLLQRLVPVVDEMLDRGRDDGSIHSRATGRELLVGIALLCQTVPGEPREFNRRLVGLFVDGLRSPH